MRKRFYNVNWRYATYFEVEVFTPALYVGICSNDDVQNTNSANGIQAGQILTKFCETEEAIVVSCRKYRFRNFG